MNKCRHALLVALACAPVSAQPAGAAAAGFDLTRPEIVEFVNEVVSRDGLSRTQVRSLLKEAQPQPKIIEIMNRPIERVAPWWEYRDRFLSAERISEGVRFWFD
ncbi:MAG TPA: lytic murein transglycosylase, partial [Steroidobacteraceae bacterium]